MNELTDQQLLRNYTAHRSDPAFAELVHRHLDLVHSVAQRMVGDTHLARDVTQATFVALAQQAAQLSNRPALSGWLHTTARNLAVKTIRTDARRRVREQESVTMHDLLSPTPDAPWEQIAPHLDAALGELTEPERDAVLLRYFEKKSAGEIGSTLGISSDAAQKRVSRAVERLREFFAKRGVTVGAGGLVVVISVNAVQAAPVGLAITISTAALAGTAATTSTLIAATTKTIAMTTLQKTLVTVTVAVLAGAGVYQAKQTHDARAEVAALQQQQVPLTEQVRQLQNSFADATNRLADLLTENALLKSDQNQNELLKLRGQNNLLARKNQELQALIDATPSGVPDSEIDLEDYPTPISFGDLGQDTPENTVKTFLWAVATNNKERLMELLILPEGLSASGRAEVEKNLKTVHSPLIKGVKLNVATEFSKEGEPADYAFVEGQTITESVATDESGDSTTITTVSPSSTHLRRDTNKWRIAFTGKHSILFSAR